MDHLEATLGDSMAGYTRIQPWERIWLGILYHVDDTGKFPDPEELGKGRGGEAWALYVGRYIEGV